MLVKAVAGIILAAAAATPAAFAQETAKSGYADINGLKYYYEITGKGDPLLLLHGGLFSIDMYAQLRAALANDHRVIAVDLHGHGRTALGNRDISLIDQGTDMAALVRVLGFNQVDVLGHSMGGGVAFQLAVQTPAMVRRLVLVSAPYAQDG